ncbi:hypothetical protein [Mesorhizobium amorphae]|uniref:hypothetical protein n=1 Tax=Mesorhizobium amorphae TaxID=71433 RepID=UPI0031F509E8
MAGFDGSITLTPAQLAMLIGHRLARARTGLEACAGGLKKRQNSGGSRPQRLGMKVF